MKMSLFHAVIFVLAISKVFAEKDSQELWETQMQELQNSAKEFSLKEPEISVYQKTGLDFFNISFESQTDMKTVHSLRPQDIDVVGAMGDSITAATGAGANTIAGIAIQYRGISWTSGGEETLNTSITITNILRKFNPKVKGYGLGNGVGFQTREEDWFNVAVPGARAKDMPDQARDLVNRMKNDSRTNFENDWKVISMFIGGNDLCALDRDPIGASAETYRDNVKEGLDILHAEVPRAIVQIIQIMEIYLLPQVSDGFGTSRICKLAQRLACPHVVLSNSTIQDEIKEINQKYQDLINELVSSGRYDTNPNFTVVVQPFFQDTVLPHTEDGQVDATFFAPDCFHFSSKGHALGALNLWNNMLEPEGKKKTTWGVSDIKCPTAAAPYIFTRINSPGYDVTTRPNDVTHISDTTCPKLHCSTPDWLIGVIAASLAGIAIQLMWLLYALTRAGAKESD